MNFAQNCAKFEVVGVKKGQPKYSIYTQFTGDLTAWGISEKDTPVVNIQTFNLKSGRKAYKDQVDAIPSLWDPKTGVFKVDIPEKLCKTNADDVSAFSIRLQWSIDKILGATVSDIVAADTPKQPEQPMTFKQRMATYQKRAGMLRQSK